MSDTSLNEEFYNCTESWFGSRCQYSFGFNKQISFNEIIEAMFQGRHLLLIESMRSKDLKARINVSLTGIDIPAYLVGYFFTLSNKSNPITTIKIQKLTFFQHSVTFYNDLTCFSDEAYICLCTNEHHANCMEFKHDRNFECKLKKYCANEAQCVQDHPTCPSTRIYICPECFFGNECQFYAKALGSTLDKILNYEFKQLK
ncbi:unnamed protein product [Adineta steineri]|uniref:EGF-like domain-containing protein n=1 Tax=Adineta steineri TaxID=433720 RepID=A0A814GA38_9BILA|nr:unnamed protein product [Adineta steineri]CAF3887167.1 unnamed protein product [Adineta steineri]